MRVSKNISRVLEDLIVDAPDNTNKHKVLIVATEAAPYAKIGGFSSVVGYLSRALIKKGHDVRVIIPKFGFIDEGKYPLETVLEGLKVPTNDLNNPELICNVKKHKLDGVVTYFLENQEYYEKRANVYGYSDDPTRWALLSRGALEFIRSGEFVPEVIHCNDWHTGILPNYLATRYKSDQLLSKISTVFTIHNLAFQGMFDHNNVSELDYDDGRSEIVPFFDDRLNKLNFMRRGILHSDVVSTVSKNYSKEILTPEFGEGLDKLLSELRSKVFGIINGLDYEEYNPMTDSLIAQNYDIKSLGLRSKNKTELQKEFNLQIRDDVPVLGFVGRLDHMKGIDLLVSTLHHVLKDFDVQFVHVGGGDGGLSEMLHDLQEKFPTKVGIHTYPNFTLPRLLFSGADMILYPSRFEPCGIVQLEAMRYGAIPIVRKVGGLADTVESYDSVTGTGTGFVFSEFNQFSLFAQIVRALEIYKNKDKWRALQKNAMGTDFSWDYSATEYAKLYRISQNFKQKKEINPRLTNL